MTLRGIAENVQFMCGTYGESVWEDLAVAIVSDGRSKANEKTLDWMTQRGLFDEKLMTVEEVGLNVDMHLFEHTMQMVKSWNQQVSKGAYYKPLQAIFALKQLNAGKLNSHLWFFNAFAEQLLPEYTVLLDVGTIPGKDAIFRLIRSMDRDPFMAGVCGEIAVYEPKLGNFIEASQNFEYKISNIMDKSLESIFGFISVLPGAFSAYRYCAIRMDDEGEGPLAEYFRSINSSMRELGPFKGNMYLAEDRILCFELLSRKGCKWTLHYVKVRARSLRALPLAVLSSTAAEISYATVLFASCSPSSRRTPLRTPTCPTIWWHSSGSGGAGSTARSLQASTRSETSASSGLIRRILSSTRSLSRSSSAISACR